MVVGAASPERGLAFDGGDVEVVVVEVVARKAIDARRSEVDRVGVAPLAVRLALDHQAGAHLAVAADGGDPEHGENAVDLHELGAAVAEDVAQDLARLGRDAAAGRDVRDARDRVVARDELAAVVEVLVHGDAGVGVDVLLGRGAVGLGSRVIGLGSRIVAQRDRDGGGIRVRLARLASLASVRRVNHGGHVLGHGVGVDAGVLIAQAGAHARDLGIRTAHNGVEAAVILVRHRDELGPVAVGVQGRDLGSRAGLGARLAQRGKLIGRDLGGVLGQGLQRDAVVAVRVARDMAGVAALVGHGVVRKGRDRRVEARRGRLAVPAVVELALVGLKRPERLGVLEEEELDGDRDGQVHERHLVRVRLGAVAQALGLLVERDVDGEANGVAQADARDARDAHAAGHGDIEVDGEGALGVLPVKHHGAKELLDLGEKRVVAVRPIGDAADLGRQREAQTEREREEDGHGADHHLEGEDGLALKRHRAAQADPPGLGLKPLVGGVQVNRHADAHRELRRELGAVVLVEALGARRVLLLAERDGLVDGLVVLLLKGLELVVALLDGAELPRVQVLRLADGAEGHADLEVAERGPVEDKEIGRLPHAEGAPAQDRDLVGELEAVVAGKRDARQGAQVARARVVEGGLLELREGDREIAEAVAKDAHHKAVALCEGLVGVAHKEAALELGLEGVGVGGIRRDGLCAGKADEAQVPHVGRRLAGEGVGGRAPAEEVHGDVIGLAVLEPDLRAERVLGVVGGRVEEARLGVLDVQVVEADGAEVRAFVLGRGARQEVERGALDVEAQERDVVVARVGDGHLQVGGVRRLPGVLASLGAVRDVDGEIAEVVGRARVGLLARRVVAGDLGAGHGGQVLGRGVGGELRDVDRLEDDRGLRGDADLEGGLGVLGVGHGGRENAERVVEPARGRDVLARDALDNGQRHRGDKEPASGQERAARKALGGWFGHGGLFLTQTIQSSLAAVYYTSATIFLVLSFSTAAGMAGSAVASRASPVPSASPPSFPTAPHSST